MLVKHAARLPARRYRPDPTPFWLRSSIVQGVLNDSVLAEYRENGFVRTGIHVPTELLSRVHATYKAMPSSASNWSYFGTTSLDKSISGKGRARLRWHLVRKFAPWVLHLHTRLVLYRKAIFGSSDALPDVLEACLDQGLAGCLGAIPWAVSRFPSRGYRVPIGSLLGA